jgi:hypothetical protein
MFASDAILDMNPTGGSPEAIGFCFKALIARARRAGRNKSLERNLTFVGRQTLLLLQKL